MCVRVCVVSGTTHVVVYARFADKLIIDRRLPRRVASPANGVTRRPITSSHIYIHYISGIAYTSGMYTYGIIDFADG